jgi:hypothetical protein
MLLINKSSVPFIGKKFEDKCIPEMPPILTWWAYKSRASSQPGDLSRDVRLTYVCRDIVKANWFIHLSHTPRNICNRFSGFSFFVLLRRATRSLLNFYFRSICRKRGVTTISGESPPQSYPCYESTLWLCEVFYSHHQSALTYLVIIRHCGTVSHGKMFLSLCFP